MATLDRIAQCVRRASARRERLLAVYLTVGDPLAADPRTGDPLSAALAAVAAGADILELGIPTPTTSPRGADVRDSFERARPTGTQQAWELLRLLRGTVPQTPLLPLVYPATVNDLGWDRLIDDARQAGADGLVLTSPAGGADVRRVAAAGLSAIPLVTPSTPPGQARELEEHAEHLTYRNLASGTGEPLDLEAATETAARMSQSAAKPFLVGFGIRHEHEIRALAPHAAGVVLGSRPLRILGESEPELRLERLRAATRRWKAATVLTEKTSGAV
ncbi:tryptophan synthase subunit alpha [Salinactinospora qingdaonensis]|uniref:tryptophan synthase n=1 Tax=Salinactinospora qingdaonensis TaxID=702744 RepID=A0ABP7FXR3_9ACTN